MGKELFFGNRKFFVWLPWLVVKSCSNSSVERIDYANDTATASPKGPVSENKQSFGATGNASFGYFGGGSGPKSTVDRIDYSNDTATASPKGPLSTARNELAATGNSFFGYFAGGYSAGQSVVDRIDYSNDTATASPKGPLSQSSRGFYQQLAIPTLVMFVVVILMAQK